MYITVWITKNTSTDRRALQQPQMAPNIVLEGDADLQEQHEGGVRGIQWKGGNPRHRTGPVSLVEVNPPVHSLSQKPV